MFTCFLKFSCLVTKSEKDSYNILSDIWQQCQQNEKVSGHISLSESDSLMLENAVRPKFFFSLSESIKKSSLSYLSSENTWDVLILQPTSFSAIPNCFRKTQWVQICFNVALNSCTGKSLSEALIHASIINLKHDDRWFSTITSVP